MRHSVWADRLMTLSVRFVGLSILTATIAASGASFFYNRSKEAEQASRTAIQINGHVRDQLAVLEAVRALYQSDKAANGKAIRSYLAALNPQARAPGMVGVGIAVAILRSNPSAAEEQLRENYGRDIRVWPTTQLPVGFPIILIEPDTNRNRRALGYDMFSDPVRRTAMRRAWKTSRPATSGVVELVQDNANGRTNPGFLIYLPVYALASDRENRVVTAQGARPISAFVYAPFRIDDLLRAALGSQLDAIHGIEVFAGAGPSAARVFEHGNMGWDTQIEQVQIGDQKWEVHLSYGRFLDRLGQPLAIFLFGAALALVAAQLHRVQQRRVGVFRALAEEKARYVEDRELMIGELGHRLKNAFARIGALARITLREADDLDDFETKFEGRLRAISAAKQMIVAGVVDTVELGEIIRRELDLAGWPADRLAALSGPEIRLDDDTAQALALAIHELVTNSIKYGALAGKGQLHVDWNRKGDDIHLSWIESGLPETPKIDTEGFGSHFIRSLIERQLKGKWDRDASDHKLAIAIRWPNRPPQVARAVAATH